MRRYILFLAASLLLITPCFADTEDYINTDEIEKSLPEYAADILGETEIGSADDIDGMGTKIISSLKTELHKAFDPALRRGLSILAIAFICSVFDVFGNEKAPLYMKLCGCAAVSLVCAGDMGSYISLGTETLNSISEFSNALLPALCTAGIFCGTPLASAAKYAASALFLDIMVYVSSKIVLPAILAYTAIIIASAAFDSKALSGMANLFKWICTSLLTAINLIFVVYISISSAVSSGGDAVASKIAKTAISTALPVVGGIISDAASAVVAGAELVRNLVGVYGLFALLAICVVPFAMIGLNYLILKASAALVSTFASNGIGELIKGLGSSLGMILALVGSTGIMLFISIISCIKAVAS